MALPEIKRVLLKLSGEVLMGEQEYGIDPVYVARMIVFLASDDAAMCSSNNYMVEAGSI